MERESSWDEAIAIEIFQLLSVKEHRILPIELEHIFLEHYYLGS